jgi:hypothetical protein
MDTGAGHGSIGSVASRIGAIILGLVVIVSTAATGAQREGGDDQSNA